MASGDKTYCGQADRSHVDGKQESNIQDLAKKLGVCEQDIIDVMEQVGPDLVKVEAYFRSKENAY